METVRIGLVGDYNPSVSAHTTIPRALHLAANHRFRVEPVWLPTRALSFDTNHMLDECDGLWCVPGCPYESMDGALKGIQFAREQKRPFLGTSGGFQHAVIEFMRNAAGVADAGHAEITIDTRSPVISLLEKPLLGVRSKVNVIDGTRFASLYGLTESVEEYYCRYGFNAMFSETLESAGMRVGAIGSDGNVHGIELRDHPFFVATLYLLGAPAMSGKVHPLVRGFVGACNENKSGRAGSASPG